MKNKKTSLPNIVVITSFFPFRGAESQVGHELVALKKEGLNIILIPRSITGPVIGKDAETLYDNSLIVPFINPSIISTFFKVIIKQPKLMMNIFIWLFHRSSTLIEFIKGVMIVPKGLYLGYKLKSYSICHICAHQLTTVADIGFILSKMLKVPWSSVIHSPDVVFNKKPEIFETMLKSMKFLRSIDACAVNRLNSIFKMRYCEKLITIHHGLNCNVIDTPEDKKRFKSTFEILTVATLREYKGIEYALEAANLLLERGIDNFHWRIAGQGHLYKALMSTIRNSNLNRHVELVGILPNHEILEIYSKQAVDVFVMPSITALTGQTEGIPHSLKEAMLYNIPVIATDSGSIREIVDGKTGLLIPEKNSNAIADAIEFFIKNQTERLKYGRRGCERVLNEFNLTNIVPVLKRVFIDV